MPKTAALLFLLPALLLGACGQTDSVTAAAPVAAPVSPAPVSPAPAPATAPAAVATLSLRVFVPAAEVGRQYVSPAISSLRVQLGSLDTTLALSSAQCSAATGGQTCTFSLNAAPGAGQTLTVSAYDAASHLLGTSTQAINVVSGQDNPLALTLTGVAASASVTVTDRAADVTAAADAVLLDVGGTYSVGVVLKDAANQTILNPGRPTETVGSSNPAFRVSSTGVGTLAVVAPDPTGSAQSTVLTVRDAGGALLGTRTLSVPAQGVALTLASSEPVAGSSLLFSARLTSARGRPLAVVGRDITFSASAGTFDHSQTGSDTLTTDVAGMVSGTLYASPVSGASAAVTASSGGVSSSANYTSVAGNADTTSSSVVFSPAAVRSGGTSTLSVILKDRLNNPVTTAPTVTSGGAATLGAAAQSGNVFTYTVTAATPELATFTVTSGGRVVGAANLAVTGFPLVVSDGGSGAPLTSGAQYDFQSGAAHSFAVTERGYTGSFSASSSNARVAAASVSGGVLSVTPGAAAGLSTITVTDTLGQKFTFDVSVTTASLIIN